MLPGDSACPAFMPHSLHCVPSGAVVCAPPYPLHYLGISLLSEFSLHTFKVLSPLWVGGSDRPAPTFWSRAGSAQPRREPSQSPTCLSFIPHVQTYVCVHIAECVWGARVS